MREGNRGRLLALSRPAPAGREVGSDPIAHCRSPSLGRGNPLTMRHGDRESGARRKPADRAHPGRRAALAGLGRRPRPPAALAERHWRLARAPRAVSPRALGHGDDRHRRPGSGAQRSDSASAPPFGLRAGRDPGARRARVSRGGRARRVVGRRARARGGAAASPARTKASPRYDSRMDRRSGPPAGSLGARHPAALLLALLLRAGRSDPLRRRRAYEPAPPRGARPPALHPAAERARDISGS